MSASIDMLRSRLGPLSGLMKKDLDLYFNCVLRYLRSKADGGDYEGCTMDNLSYMERYTCDDPYMALKGRDRARQIWQQKYWPEVQRMHFLFRSEADFEKFHYRWNQKFPRMRYEMQEVHLVDEENDAASLSTSEGVSEETFAERSDDAAESRVHEETLEGDLAGLDTDAASPFVYGSSDDLIAL